MSAAERHGSLNSREDDAVDRFLVEAMPLPIASAWHRVLQHRDESHTASVYAVEALATTLRFLLALQLAEADERCNTSSVRKELAYLDKPRLGSYGQLVLGLARVGGPDGSISGALGAHFYTKRGQTMAARELQRLGQTRNDLIHGGSTRQLDDRANLALLADLRRWLFALAWLADWRLVHVERADVVDGGFVGQIVPLTGRDREPHPRSARWTAFLPTREPVLVDPTESLLLPLDGLVRVQRTSGRVDVLLPERRVGRTLRLARGADITVFEDVPLASPDVSALLGLGRSTLANSPPESLGSSGAWQAAETSLRVTAQSWTVPKSGEPERDTTTRGGGALLAGLLAIAALGLLAYWILVPADGARSRIAPDLAFGRAPGSEIAGLPAGVTEGDLLAQREDAEAASTDDAVGLLGANASLAALALAQQAWDARTDGTCGALDDLAATLCADQERLDADAAALDAALRWDRRCDRQAAVALAAALRLRDGDGVDRLHVLRRALALERHVVASARADVEPAGSDPGAAARERAAAAARALADVAAIIVWTDGDPKQRVEAATGEASVQALRGLELSLLCALDEAADLRDVAAGEWARLARLDLERLDILCKHVETSARLAGGLDAPAAELRGCLADAYDGFALRLDAKGRPGTAAQPSARRLELHWQAAELRAADIVCCGAARAGQPCGDPVVACGPFEALADAALAACRAEGLTAAIGQAACVSAVDSAARLVASRASLPDLDPRCLPAIFVPQRAAEVLQALRRDVPAPVVAATMPKSASHEHHDDDLGRWLQAIDALGARASRGDMAARSEAAREFAPHALAAARVLFVRSYTPRPGGCASAARAAGDSVAVATSEDRRRWSVRSWLQQLENSQDAALVSEAQALLCRVLAAEGEAAALQERVGSGRCPR